jgi:hypothetical protein
MEWTKVSESPDAFHFWTGVGTIAGALRSCVWIDENIFTYTPNFFLFFVAPPGIAAKSTSISLGMRLLEQVPEIRFGPSSLTWQHLLRQMQAAVITVRWKDEAGKEHQRSASAVTIEASELGTFLKLSQEGLAESLIDLWDGKISKRGFTHGTVGSGNTTVENPWLHVVGATTPAWLGQNFPEEMVYGGLTSRILFIYGDRKRQFVAYPSQVMPTKDFQLTEGKLVHDLEQMSLLRGPMMLTQGARDWGQKWYETLWTVRPKHLASSRFDGYRARKQALLHKIAMVVSAATREDRLITEGILAEADQHLMSAEGAMLRVFESIGLVTEAKWVREITSVVRTYNGVFPAGMTSKQLYQLVANSISVRDFQTALVSAVESGALERVVVTKTTEGKEVFGVRVPVVGPAVGPAGQG